MNGQDDSSRRHRGHAPYSRHRRRSRRHGWRRYLAPALALLAVVAVALLYLWSEPDGRDFAAAPAHDSAEPMGSRPAERTAALPPLSLPADDAPHGSAMEWWYYNGILDGQAGQRYAFHVAVFVANNLIKHTVMHVALTDLQSGKRYTGQNRTGGVPAKSMDSGFDFRKDDWRFSGSGPLHTVRASIEGASISLDLRDAHPVVAHRAADSKTPGLLDFGDSGISYYYSRPRMAATGEVRAGGKTVAVTGNVWFDHQWGEFDVLKLGWNWLALHLADGSDLMLYQLFDTAGRPVMTAGTQTRDGQSRALRADEITLTPTGRWTSARTRVEYPVEWKLTLPSGVLEIRPLHADSEFDASATTTNVYWEGPVKVTGSSKGQGFMELSGYERQKPAPAEAPRR